MCSAIGEASRAAGIGGDKNPDSKLHAGAVYSFARGPSSPWFPTAYIKASNPDTDDYFGTTLAISGDTIAVGAPSEDSDATGVHDVNGAGGTGDAANNKASSSGAVYVFR